MPAWRGFRRELHECFTARADALLELCDAVLCAQGPVRSAAELSLEPEFRRGHGSVYDALAGGQIDAGRLRRLQVAAMTPAAAGDPLMFGIDVTPLARPDAVFADELVMVQCGALAGGPVPACSGVSASSSLTATALSTVAAAADRQDGVVSRSARELHS